LPKRINEVIAGIDIGGTKIAVALETLDGEKRAKAEFAERWRWRKKPI